MRVAVQMRNNAITIQGLRVYLAERYGIRKGNRIKYTERGEEKVERDGVHAHNEYSVWLSMYEIFEERSKKKMGIRASRSPHLRMGVRCE